MTEDGSKQGRFLTSFFNTVLLVLLCFALAGCSSLLSIGRSTPSGDKPVVEKVPKGALDRPALKPYQGLHPRLLKRPDDPFEYPIQLGDTGPITPIFSGPLRYPLLCQTQESGLGQPLVDNHEGIGIPVYADENDLSSEIIGHSQDCSLATGAAYYYNQKDTTTFLPYSTEVSNEVITQIQVNGQTIPFILRVEWGTINRYIYSILALKDPNETLESPGTGAWNQRLIVKMSGGVGIGFKQGKNKPISLAESRYEQFSKGYALVFSSGLQTSNHYNIWESEELVLRLKNQFTALYAKPLYTVGLGASGGGLSQYLLSQNNPGLLDAGIPQYSYPDMVSQTIYALDCDLLEHYFDLGDRDNHFWEKWENRTLIQGLSARSVKEHDYAKLYQWSKLVNGFFPTRPRGVSECVLGWRGPAQVTHNPKYTHYYHRFSKDIVRENRWTHWENLRQFYGTDEHGFANALWDNEGVQYGLAALQNGDINFKKFIDINRHVGSWKPQHKMQVARFWKFSGERDPLSELNIWSTQNMLNGSSRAPAPRGVADPLAIEGAFRSGMVFVGAAHMPIIDVRHYMDDVQDMHHSFASFSTRQRMINANGHAKNQAVWMAKRDFDPTNKAFEVIDEWVLRRLENPGLSVAAAKPQSAMDTCFDETGKVMFAGEKVWDGAWNQQPEGACLKQMPNFRSTRQVAGEDITDLTFKCTKIPVESAIAKGFYKSVSIDSDQSLTEEEQERLLSKTFPNGVCDYSRQGLGELSAQELGL